MDTAELLEEALSLAARLGYRVRQEWLDGQGGGPCVVRGEQWLFVDLAQSLGEQLASVAGALREDRRVQEMEQSEELAEYLKSGSEPLMNADVR